jgi:hypothetical protein
MDGTLSMASIQHACVIDPRGAITGAERLFFNVGDALAASDRRRECNRPAQR